MKKIISIVLVLSMICVLTACYQSEDSAVSYSANLDTNVFYNIGAYTSALSDSPVIVSDEDSDKILTANQSSNILVNCAVVFVR